MSPLQDQSKFPFLKNAAMRSSFFLALSGMLLTYSGCNSNNSKSPPPTFDKGAITVLEEVKKDEFLIADETLINTKSDSKVITKFLDGKVDTLDYEQIQAVKTKHSSGSSYSFDDPKEVVDSTTTVPNNTHTDRSGGNINFFRTYRNYRMFCTMDGGVMGNVMSNDAMSQPNPAVYKNRSTYNRVNNASKGYFSSRRATATRGRASRSGSARRVGSRSGG